MSEDRTAERNGSKSFEERVFARFDAMDNRFNRMEDRFDRVEKRIEVLESKQYDTKPIWEQALSEITRLSTQVDRLSSETGADIEKVNTEIGKVNTEIGRLNTEVARLATEIQGLHTKIDSTNVRMDAGFEQIRTDFDFALRGVERKIDVLNHNILDLRAEQRYVDSRLEKLESQPKPS